MDKSIENLTAKQKQAVLLLAQGRTARVVGKRLKVSAGTVNNWRSQNGSFKTALEVTQRQMFEAGIRQIKALMMKSAHILHEVMDDPDSSNREKIAAAKVVLQCVNIAVSEPMPTITNYQQVDNFIERMGLQ